MKYNILTHEEFKKIYEGRRVSMQKYCNVRKRFIFSHRINSYKVVVGNILCIEDYQKEMSYRVVLFFIDKDCVIEFTDYDKERESNDGKEPELYDLTKDNNILTFKEAFEIAVL